MKKRLLFILIVFIAWLPCYSKTGIYVLSACVVRGLYLHGLPTGYASWAEAGLYDSGIPYGHPSPIDFSISLDSGRWLKKVLKGNFLIMGILVSAIFSVDVALYSFWGFRLDATLFFYLQSPADAMASVPLGMFFIQLLVFVAYALGIYAWFTFISGSRQ